MFLLKGIRTYRQDTDLITFFRTFLELKEITHGITTEVKKKQVRFKRAHTSQNRMQNDNDLSGLDKSVIQDSEIQDAGFEDDNSYIEMGVVARQKMKKQRSEDSKNKMKRTVT